MRKFNKRVSRKSGFTLVELLIVLSVLSLGVFMASPNLKVYSDKKASIEMNYAVEGIIELVNTGKAYGRLNEKDVLVKVSGSELVLVDVKIVGRFKFPPSIARVKIMSGNTISINSLGIATANTITINSENTQVKQEIITVKVGTAYTSKQKK